jgi:hypothetical protein
MEPERPGRASEGGASEGVEFLKAAVRELELAAEVLPDPQDLTPEQRDELADALQEVLKAKDELRETLARHRVPAKTSGETE